MADSPSTARPLDPQVPHSLDEVLADCLTAMERGQSLDRSQVLSRFPQWADELREFFENWDEMERFSSQLGNCRRQLTELTPEGARVRYFGDYELLGEIGHGGMGVIHKARQLSLDRIVALKMILDTRHDRERFRLEAEVAARLDHAHIVSIYEVGEFESHPYFSMQFIDGQNVSERLAERGPFSPSDAARLTTTLAAAVHYAHQRGVLHRDLKPANVLLDANGQPHVTDFGLAKQLRSDEGQQEITASGAILGTPSYMSPEQAEGRGSRVTTSTDVYGLGAILYALLTGQAPFSSPSSMEVLRKVIDQKPTSPRAVRPEIPRDLETICLKCLEKEPSARYGSAQALADDLQRFLRHEPIEARPISLPERTWRWCRRNRLLAALLLLIGVLLIGTSVVTSLLAHREYLARLAADAGQQRERTLRAAVDQSMRAEQSSRLAALATLAESFATNGLFAHEHEEPQTALLWFHEAWRQSTPSSRQRRENEIRVRSWYAQSPRPIQAMRFPDHDFVEMTFDPRGQRLLCRSRAGGGYLWDVEQDTTTTLPWPAQLRLARWHPQADGLAISDDLGQVALIDPQKPEALWSHELDDVAAQLVFSPDGKLLAAAHAQAVSLWAGLPHSPELTRLSLPDDVLFLAFDPTSQRLLVACADGRCRIVQQHEHRWQTLHETIPCLTRTRETGQLLVEPAFLADGKYLLTAIESAQRSRPEYIRIEAYDVATARRIGWRSVGVSHDLRVSPSGDRFLNVGEFYSRLTELTLRAHPERLPHRGIIATAEFSRDGRFVATGGSDKLVRIWTSSPNPFPEVVLNAGCPTSFLLPHQQSVVSISWASERRLATAQADGLVRIWDLPTDDPVRPVPDELLATDGNLATPLAPPTSPEIDARDARVDPATIQVTRLSPDGQHVALGCRDGQARVLRWPSKLLVQHQLAHQGAVLDVIFTPDSQHLLTLGSDGWIKVWSVASGKLALHPMPARDASARLQLSGDPRYVLLQGPPAATQVIDLSDLADSAPDSSAAEWLTDSEHTRLFAELVSGKRLDAGSTRDLTTDEWLERWQRYRP